MGGGVPPGAYRTVREDNSRQQTGSLALPSTLRQSISWEQVDPVVEGGLCWARQGTLPPWQLCQVQPPPQASDGRPQTLAWVTDDLAGVAQAEPAQPMWQAPSAAP